MALEIFGKLDSNGESNNDDHVFFGRKQDLTNIAKWLNEAFQLNKRKKAVLNLADKFTHGSLCETPFVRLNTVEANNFHAALTQLSEKKKSASLSKIVKILNESLHIY
jgi:hypothetical protein